jgi:hypothetical protein
MKDLGVRSDCHMGLGQASDWGSGYKRLRLRPSEAIKEYSTEYLSLPTVHLPPPSSSSSLLPLSVPRSSTSGAS